MLTNALNAQCSPLLHTAVQSCTAKRCQIPTSAVTLEVLKTMEQRLGARGLLPEPTGPSFSYLWFIAETERNVLLWRNGLSISQADEFEFWVLVPELISKRLRQLELRDQENPFLNPLWGATNQTPAYAGREIDYLSAFAELFQKITEHAHALSHVGSILRNEFSVERARREVILLPHSRAGTPP